MQGEPPRYMTEMFGELQQGNLERASDLQTRIWVDGIYREPEQVDAAMRQHWMTMNQIAVKNNTFLIADSQPVNPLNPPAVERLGEIQVPTLIVVGSLDHPELLRAADVMREQIPEAEKIIIDAAAHMLNMEKPDEFNRIVLDFLAKQ
jgi:pimeloyl-ACP methyl ester carboxylesterase